MKISILTLGSRGDVQPFLALGLGLAQAGHQVTLAADPAFETWIRSAGLNFAPVHFNLQEFMQHPAIQRARHSMISFMLAMRQIMAREIYRLLDDFWHACQHAELIIASPPLAFGGYDCAERLNIPLVAASVQPFLPTRVFPSFFLARGPHLGGWYNYLTHLALEQGFWHWIRGWLNCWRSTRLKLPPATWRGPFARMREQQTPFIFGYSPSLVPKPLEWQPWHHVTGYWFLDPPASWQPPARLLRFLAAGPAPIYLGLNHLHAAEPDRTTQISVEALQQAGQRGILGWEAADLPTAILPLGNVPHDWLFPQVAAVVHHGGAGITGACLRAGVPSIIVPLPFGTDQHAWAQVVAQRGAGVQIPSTRHLTVQTLAQAITTAITNRQLRASAALLGYQVRAEQGVQRAVEVIFGIRMNTSGVYGSG